SIRASTSRRERSDAVNVRDKPAQPTVAKAPQPGEAVVAPKPAPQPIARTLDPAEPGELLPVEQIGREAAIRWTLTPLNRRRWRTFKANRRGYWSLWIFLVLFVFTLFAEFIANDKPIVAYYKGEILFPVLVDYPESKFGGFLAVTDYKDKEILKE